MQYFNTIVGTDIEPAAAYLNARETVAIPTETVYGLAANALSEEAVLKIFTSKGRPHFDPLIVHTFSAHEIEKYVGDIPPAAQKLMDAFMPGPLTLLLPKQKIVPDLVTSGLDTVAIRVPNHPLALKLLRQLDFPLAAPSANPFGYISPTTAQHVFDQLHGKIPYILDGGPATVGVESTIIGFENEQAIIYRPGGLSMEDIEKVVGKVVLNILDSANPKVPGSLKSHYAPRTRLVIGDINVLTANDLENGRIGVIAFDTYEAGIDQKYQIMLSAGGSLAEAAKNLFAAMRTLDKAGLDIILAVKFPETGLGYAINDRLKRASA